MEHLGVQQCLKLYEMQAYRKVGHRTRCFFCFAIIEDPKQSLTKALERLLENSNISRGLEMTKHVRGKREECNCWSP